MEHHLRCWPAEFAAIRRGEKTAEFRRDDRSPRFAPGDELVLWEWEPETPEGPADLLHVWRYFHRDRGHYTGERELVQVTHVTRDAFGVPAGYAVLSVARLVTLSRDATGREVVRA